LGIVEALNCKLWAHSDKCAVLECINNEIINKSLTRRQWEAQVHVCPMSNININVSLQHLLLNVSYTGTIAISSL
jgi:hypothetical protein